MSTAGMLELLGWIEDDQGNYQAARSRLEEAYHLFSALGSKNYAMRTLRWLGITDRRAGHYEAARSSFEEIIAYHRDRGDKVALRFDLLDLGETLSNLGEYEQAAIYLRESLHLLQPTKDPRHKGYAVFSLTKVLHHTGRSHAPACLLGALESETHEDVWKLVASRMADYFQCVESVKAILGEVAFIVAMEAGRQMSLDEALDFALKTAEDITD